MTRLQPDVQLIMVSQARFLSSPNHWNWLWGPPQPPIHWIPGEFWPWVQQMGHEVDYSDQSIAKVKNRWTYTSSAPNFIGCTETTLPLQTW